MSTATRYVVGTIVIAAILSLVIVASVA